MKQYLFMCPTLTWAQKLQRTLERSGLSASTVKAPQKLGSGCNYAVSIYRDFDRAYETAMRNDLIRGKIYAREDDGEYTVVGAV